MKYLLKEVAQIIKGRILQGNPNLVCAGASTDSRQVLEGDIFFCLIGERSDGHDFIKQARDNGAVAAVIEHDVTPPDGSIVLIEVESTLSALSVLAHYHRTKTRVNVIGVTGSVGKTSTKDIVHSVLSQRFRTYKNPGNLNSHIGLPLAVLGMVSDYDNAVLEMAMRKRGEITQLCEIALPSYGVITDISASHIGVVGSMDDIALGKAELLDYLPSNGKAFLCFDNNIIKDISHRARCPVVYYGFGEGADYMGFDVKNNRLRSVFKVLHKAIYMSLNWACLDYIKYKMPYAQSPWV